MHPRLKYILAFLVTMMTWLAAAPVWASGRPAPASFEKNGLEKNAPSKVSRPSRVAPMCDTRGATMFGMPPVLDAPSASVDVGHEDECLPVFDGLGNSYEQGRHPSRASSSPVAPEAVLPSAAGVPRHGFIALISVFFAADGGPAGVSPSIERPPRAA